MQGTGQCSFTGDPGAQGQSSVDDEKPDCVGQGPIGGPCGTCGAPLA
ncbi:Uncharacterised protein [Mycobacteroides abscessus subsp. abscessus]|nr:Uncharacterised protein [Mycobacteroides abscessus subsp. abscessus]